VARIRRGRPKKRSPSRVSSLGSRAKSRSSSSRVGSLGSRAKSRSSSSRVSGLGSKAGSRSSRRLGGVSTSQPFQRQRYRIRRPRSGKPYTGIGIGYPRRYRSRPMSSCGCFAFFIILAILWLIFLAPSIVASLDVTLALVLPIAVVLGLFIIALWFITKTVDDNDDDNGSDPIRVIESETVLVVCPYCRAKNEQGITICANCGADI
jgi:hypothetical protein